jgi:hypothetical protein
VYQEEAPPPPPPPIEYVAPPAMTHAPKFSLYAGGSLRILGFGGYFFDNENGQPETTGNFVRNGLGAELDVGARLGHRYIPFLLFEHGFLGQGHRFEGTGTTSSSDLLGLGFRYVAGDVDTVGFLTEISVGWRTITEHNGSETYKMSAPEIFRLGLGAEIRLSTLFVLSPMAQISSGEMNDTDGNITYGTAGSKDGLTHPTYNSGQNIIATHGYLLVSIGCGAHFDFFGK